MSRPKILLQVERGRSAPRGTFSHSPESPTPAGWLPRVLLAAVLSLLAPATQGAPREESWYRLDWQGSPAGWTHEVDLPASPGSGGAVTRSESVIRVARMGTPVTLWTRSDYHSREGGSPPWLLYELAQGPRDTLRLSCRFEADSIRVVRTMGGRASRYARGMPALFLRPEQVDSLWRRPVNARESDLRYDAFVPEMDAVIPFRAHLEGRDTLRTREGVKVGLRWRIQCDPLPSLESVEWRDEGGLLWRSESPALGMRATRVSREEALASSGTAELLATTLVPLNRPLDSPLPYRSVAYQIANTGGAGPFRPPLTPLTRLLTVGDSTSVVESRHQPLPPSLAPDISPEDTSPLRPEERERALRSTLLMEADDPAIRRAAREAVGTESTPWGKACRLQKFVSERIRNKDLEVLFASAARTLESGEGDCTEHAILLAALARAEGIPSRLVAGLVAVGDRMAYHLWTEVDAGMGWIGLDAALDRAPVDGRYLPLAVSDLAEDSLAPLSLGVLDTVGRIRIRILQAEEEAP